jgi:hypothetical protein
VRSTIIFFFLVNKTSLRIFHQWVKGLIKAIYLGAREFFNKKKKKNLLHHFTAGYCFLFSSLACWTRINGGISSLHKTWGFLIVKPQIPLKLVWAWWNVFISNLLENWDLGCNIVLLLLQTWVITTNINKKEIETWGAILSCYYYKHE